MIPIFEPQICIALAENSGFGIKLHGEYSIDSSDNEIIYTPVGKNDHAEVSGINIGHQFHWQRKQTLLFNGSLLMRRDNSGGCLLINRIPAEEYLCSVISSEMNPDAPVEFLAAHAIISRTWLFNKIYSRKGAENDTNREISGQRIIDWTDTELHSGFDVCSDDHCQRYQGIGPINRNARKAIAMTRGIIISAQDGEIADARFSKCCGGKTERFSTCWQNKDYTYLESVECPYCSCEMLSDEQKQRLLPTILKDYDMETEDFYQWERIVSAEDIKHNLAQKFGRDIGDITALTAIKRGASGRIEELLITGTHGNLTLGKELMIRKLLSDSHLYSSNFSISRNGTESFTLRGKGWGHGVGLCQIGAAVMATLGSGYKEIISHYYPGTTLTKIYT